MSDFSLKLYVLDLKREGVKRLAAYHAAVEKFGAGRDSEIKAILNALYSNEDIINYIECLNRIVSSALADTILNIVSTKFVDYTKEQIERHVGVSGYSEVENYLGFAAVVGLPKDMAEKFAKENYKMYSVDTIEKIINEIYAARDTKKQ